MNSPDIKGFIETSFVDWPRRVAAVIFLPGCNFRCPYCHNHKLVLEPESFGSWDLNWIFERLEQLRGWVDGVCVTGGEPTIHADLGKLLRQFKERGWEIKLDTNGARPAVLSDLLSKNLIDAFAIDVKAPFESIPYRNNAGPKADPLKVKKSLELTASSGKSINIRTTIHPDLLSIEELLRLAETSGDILARNGAAKDETTFTPQRARVEDPLDPSLGALQSFDPSIFNEWAALAQKTFNAAWSEDFATKRRHNE